uniref:Uncharacterized protein n=1 Tax=viral metagenome TaxID=1070528 RepID=A0A6C0KQC4_9ZZZZ
MLMGKYKTRKNTRNKSTKYYKSKSKSKRKSKKQKKGGMLSLFSNKKRQKIYPSDYILSPIHNEYEPGLEMRGAPTNRQLQLIPEEINVIYNNEENEEIIGKYKEEVNPNCDAWVSVLIQDSGENNECETKESPFQSPPRIIQQVVNTPLGDYNKIKTPDTNDVIVGVSLIQFPIIIIEYLKKLEKNRLNGKNLREYLYDKLGNQFIEIPRDQETNINLNNYYKYFLCLLQARGFKIFQNNKNILDKYFNTSVFNDSNQTDFNRKEFFNFALTIFPSIDFKEKLKNKLRIDFTGEALASVTGLGTNFGNPNDQYISSFEKNKEPGIKCEEPEIEWIKKCIKNRKNNYLYKKDSSNKWKLQTVEEAKDIGEKIKNNVFKQQCAKCWICNCDIYHYFWQNNKERIYLNSKCGEDEHVFPPGVGDIIGTLNQSAKIMKKTISEKGPETLYLYSLRPSHSFCNQVKSDFLFYYLMNINGKIDETLKLNWENCCNNWFKKERYHSYENIAVEFKNSYIDYSNYTINTIRNYLNKNIAIKLKDQADLGASNIGNMLKLKLLIYIVQIGKDIIGEEFTEKWNIE